MTSKAYRGTDVKDVDAGKFSQGRDGQPLVVGVDVGKYHLWAVGRWPDGRVERPWRVANPEQIPERVRLLGALAAQRPVTVALEPSGTYGDPLRQALSAARIVVTRVSPKAAHDYAEVFDGVPSQHDGKDAAVVAELAALGKARAWPYVAKDAWEQEVAYWVDGMDAQRRIQALWLGRLEGLLARHGPEATRLLKGSSATLLQALAAYGGPAAVAADDQAAAQLKHWGGHYLTEDKARALPASARARVGVRQGVPECRRLQAYAAPALAARREVPRSQRQLQELAKGHAVLPAQGQVVGVATACVLWVSTGDPRQYDSGPAYRKALGLNLVERSSGIYQGKLKISKRGNRRARQWLYFAVLRFVRREGVQAWYQAHRGRSEREGKRALIGVMRKLVLALYQVGAHGAEFDSRRLFPGGSDKRPSAAVNPEAPGQAAPALARRG